MRVIETYAYKQYKLTLFQTSDRYLIQLEDQQYTLSWKISKSHDLNQVKQEAVEIFKSNVDDIWPEIRKRLQLPSKPEDVEDFPSII